MRRALRARSVKKMRHKTPGNRLITVFKKKRHSYMKCGKCSAKIVRKRLRAKDVKKLSKTKRRPDRPYPGLCTKCMRAKVKSMVR